MYKFTRNSATSAIKVYKVGGAVRDSFLGRESKDIDFACIGGTFEQMEELVHLNNGEIFLSTPEFFTIRAKLPELGAVDFVAGRKESGYRDGRHPDEVSYANSIEQELARRDFTMNAIAVDAETDEIIDPFGGQYDIENGVIRCVGEAIDRLQEDALRVFRAIRFAIVLDFLIHPSIIEVVRKGNINYNNVSTERIREELVKACKVNSFLTFSLLDQYNLVSLVQDRGIWFMPTTKGI